MVVISDILLRKQAKGKDLREIKEINLDKLQIELMEGFRKLNKLQILNLSFNGIVRIRGIEHLQ